MKIIDLTNQNPVPQIKNSYKVIFICSQCNSKSERTGTTYLKYGAICINCRNENRYAESRFHSENEFYTSIALCNSSNRIPQHWKFWYYCVDCGTSVHRKGQHFNYKFLCENCNKKKTSLERYGVENHAQLPEMREKTKLLFKEKKEQIKQSRIKRRLYFKMIFGLFVLVLFLAAISLKQIITLYRRRFISMNLSFIESNYNMYFVSSHIQSYAVILKSGQPIIYGEIIKNILKILLVWKAYIMGWRIFYIYYW